MQFGQKPAESQLAQSRCSSPSFLAIFLALERYFSGYIFAAARDRYERASWLCTSTQRRLSPKCQLHGRGSTMLRVSLLYRNFLQKNTTSGSSREVNFYPYRTTCTPSIGAEKCSRRVIGGRTCPAKRGRKDTSPVSSNVPPPAADSL